MKPTDWLRRRPEGFWVAAIILAVLAVGAVLTLEYWDWLRAGETGSTTIRNIGLLIGAIIAMVLAVWRSRVAGRQAATAERGLLNERYQKGAEMLGSEVLSVRLGGIYALNRLAQEHPEEHHLQIMELFCAFVRHPARDEKRGALLTLTIKRLPRQDVNVVMKAIGTRNDAQLALERQEEHNLDLHGANLSMQVLGDLNLSGARLGGANLSGASLFKTNLSNKADLFEANLSGARLPGTILSDASLVGADLSNIKDCYGADFSNANFYNSNLTDANLSGATVNGAKFEIANLSGAKFHDESGMLVKGLTQKQIRLAVAKPDDNPPYLDGLIDAETDELISWDKRPKII